MMELDLLTAISPIDGRYRSKAGALAAYFSEFALIKYRVQVEIEYFITLCELPLPQLKSFDSDVSNHCVIFIVTSQKQTLSALKRLKVLTNHECKGC